MDNPSSGKAHKMIIRGKQVDFEVGDLLFWSRESEFARSYVGLVIKIFSRQEPTVMIKWETGAVCSYGNRTWDDHWQVIRGKKKNVVI